MAAVLDNRLVRAVRRRLNRGEAGFTLVELAISLTMLAIVLPVAFSALSSMQNSEAVTTNRFTSLGEAQIIADRITKDLRTAVAPDATSAAFVAADVRGMTFYASLGDVNGPTKLRVYVANLPGTTVAVFHEDMTPAGTNVEQTRMDGRYVDTSGVIFTYFDKTGTAIAAPVDPTKLRSIEQVGISLTTRVSPTAPATTIQTRVHIRNVDYNPS
jgi:prepilin-type N-terminal cleavage/methylation domain-containing protein